MSRDKLILNGVEYDLNFMGNCHFDSNNTPKVYINDKAYYGQAVVEKTKRDWEIVAFGGKNFNEAQINAIKVDQFVHGRLGGIDTELGLKLGCPIHSVKRLSDGEVFSVGDEDQWGKIVSLSVYGYDIIAYHDGIGYQERISLLKKVVKPKPLFTTIDGKELFLGDTAFIAIDFDFVHEQILNTSDIGKWKDAKMFSTKEKAEEYILNNKPLLSVNDVQNVLNGQINRPVGIPFIESIKELAKQKLSK